MSLKSHYGWHSVQAEADFLWFSGDGEEMRGAKSPRCRIQSDGRRSGGRAFETEEAHVCLGVTRKRRRDRKAASENVLRGVGCLRRTAAGRRTSAGRAFATSLQEAGGKSLKTALTVTYSRLEPPHLRLHSGQRHVFG